jgi:hypothetical protein
MFKFKFEFLFMLKRFLLSELMVTAFGEGELTNELGG